MILVRQEPFDLNQKIIRITGAKAEGREEEVRVAPGYEETSFAVPRTYRSKNGTVSGEEEITGMLYASSDASRFLNRALSTLRAPSLMMRNSMKVPGRFDNATLLAHMEAIAAGVDL